MHLYHIFLIKPGEDGIACDRGAVGSNKLVKERICQSLWQLKDLHDISNTLKAAQCEQLYMEAPSPSTSCLNGKAEKLSMAQILVLLLHLCTVCTQFTCYVGAVCSWKLSVVTAISMLLQCAVSEQPVNCGDDVQKDTGTHAIMDLCKSHNTDSSMTASHLVTGSQMHVPKDSG